MNLDVILSKPGMTNWKKQTFTSFSDIQAFIGGRFYCLHLPYEVDIWMNATTQDPSLAPLNGCVVDEADFSYENYLYGNIFFAGRGENGGTVSLTEQQQKWIYQNTDRSPNVPQPFVFRVNVVETEVA